MKLGDKVKVINKDYADTINNTSVSLATVIAMPLIYNSNLCYVGWKETEARSEFSRSIKKTLVVNDKYEYISNITDYTHYLIMYFHELELEDNNGYNCISCNTHYPYAQANLPNNQLKCYSCRTP